MDEILAAHMDLVKLWDLNSLAKIDERVADCLLAHLALHRKLWLPILQHNEINLSFIYGGRALQRFMSPFIPQELGTDFSLNKAMQIGLLPLVWMSKDPRETLNAYVSLYLKEEIQGEAAERNRRKLSRRKSTFCLLGVKSMSQ